MILNNNICLQVKSFHIETATKESSNYKVRP